MIALLLGDDFGAMETGYQRDKIHEESNNYELLKSTGSMPIIGVNAFVDSNAGFSETSKALTLARATDAVKKSQLLRLSKFRVENREYEPRAIKKLKQVALSGDNIFAELMNTVRYCSFGQITQSLFEVSGQYRRNM